MSEKELTQRLLSWFDRNGRALPWRFKGGAHPNPYVVLVSEIMLQQTTVKTVIPYFERFMNRFPTVENLATASEEDVFLYWQGLGYYTRARSLHTSAKIIVNEFGGQFPHDMEKLSKLKGLGAYTQASFLALAFNLPETVVDGNVMRIIARLDHHTDPLEDILPKIRERAIGLTDRNRPADYASAIMDLGATICTPKNPQCASCPWQEFCLSKNDSELEKIPQRQKTPKKEMNENVLLIVNDHNEILIRKHIERGLLAGLYEFPWGPNVPTNRAEKTQKTVTHVFTHIRLTLNICILHDNQPYADGFFVSQNDLSAYPFSTLMKKVWETAKSCV